MKAIHLMSFLVVIMALTVLRRAEAQDGMPTSTSYVKMFLDDMDPPSKDILVKPSSHDITQSLSLETNLALNSVNVYDDSIGFYTYKKLVNYESSHSLMENTINHSSETKSRHAVFLNEVDFWPFMEEPIENNFEYNARIATDTPTGHFEMEQYSHEGSGYSALEPQIAFGWLNRETSLAVSVLSGLNFDNGNTTGDYQSDVFRVDTTVAHFTPFFGGFLGVGANGYYLKQISADSVSVARLGSSKMRSGGIGPVVFYLHDLGKNKLIFGAKWLPKVSVRNTSIENFVRLELTLIF